MTRRITLFLILSALPILSFGGDSNLRAFFAYNTFLAPGKGPYIETYLQFDASSLAFTETPDQRFQAILKILMLFEQDDQIKDFRKYELRSPVIDDLAKTEFSFTDQQRFVLPAGEYRLNITITDHNRPGSSINHVEDIALSYSSENISVSSVQLAEKIVRTDEIGPLTKSGHNIYPYVDYFFPSSVNTINFYSEIYNTNKILGENEPFLIVSSIETFETRHLLSDFSRFRRESAKAVNLIMSSFDISTLPSGNYFLVIAVRDRNNQTLASNRVFFQRSNPGIEFSHDAFGHVNVANTFAGQILEYDSLAYFIKALGPISTYIEKEFAYNLVNTGDMQAMQQYFFHFWQQRDPERPETAWKNYYIAMCNADAHFKTKIKRGYETDRGRVFLQYGPPNSVTTSYDEPNAYPYEIWHYYTINGQRDKRFVFFTRDFATNNFELIHSDVVGELSNHRWHLMIHSRHLPSWDVDTDFSPTHWGGRARDFYERPR